MSCLDAGSGQIVANVAKTERAAFIKRTCLHLGGAISSLHGMICKKAT